MQYADIAKVKLHIQKDIRGEITTKTSVKFGQEEESFIKEMASNTEGGYQSTSLKRAIFPSILCHAAYSGYKTTVQELLGSGAEVDHQDFIGRTPLHLAADRGQLAVAEVLLNEGADVNSVDHKERTPLYCAAIRNHVDVCRHLIVYQAKFIGPATELTNLLLK